MSTPQSYIFNGEIYEPKYFVDFMLDRIQIKFCRKGDKEYNVYDTYTEALEECIKRLRNQKNDFEQRLPEISKKINIFEKELIDLKFDVKIEEVI